MSARDELATVIESQPALLTMGNDQQDRARSVEIADAILAAGYTKPRTITTAEELDALPFKSVVMDHHGTVYHRWLRAGWQSAGPTLGHYRNTLPATVLYEPAP